MGNKFLDDLRHADALIHVVDVSGTGDAEGQCFLAVALSGVHSRRFCRSKNATFFFFFFFLLILLQGRRLGDMILHRILNGCDLK